MGKMLKTRRQVYRNEGKKSSFAHLILPSKEETPEGKSSFAHLLVPSKEDQEFLKPRRTAPKLHSKLDVEDGPLESWKFSRKRGKDPPVARKRRKVCNNVESTGNNCMGADEQQVDEKRLLSYGHLLAGSEEGGGQEPREQLRRALEHSPSFNAIVRRNRAGNCSFAHLLETTSVVKEEPLSDSEPEEFFTKMIDWNHEPDTRMVDEPAQDEGSVFRELLQRELDKPLELDQLEEMLEEVRRKKAVLKHFETRRRVGNVQVGSKGSSYLDQYPDLALKLEKASEGEQLQLLRGFFFWIQHACTPGAFKPWASVFPPSPGQDYFVVED